jgi:DNA-binding MarR family transcriptional regulator
MDLVAEDHQDWDPLEIVTGDGRHGPIHRASQEAFQKRLEQLVPGCESAGLALFIYAQGAGRHTEVFLNRLMRDEELDGPQFAALLILWCVGSPHRLSPTQLHRLLCQSAPGVTHILRRLSTRGLIRRLDDPDDARARHVELTKRGIATIRRCLQKLDAELRFVFDLATPALEDLADSQRRVAELLSRSELAKP